MPADLVLAWLVFATRYRDYLPEVEIHHDSFIANPDDADAIFRELKEIAGIRVAPLRAALTQV